MPAAKDFSHATTDAAFQKITFATKATIVATTRTRPDVPAKRDSSNVTTRDAASTDHGAATETTTAEIIRTKQDAVTRLALRDSSSAPLLGDAYLTRTRATATVIVRMDLMRQLALAPTALPAGRKDILRVQISAAVYETNGSAMDTDNVKKVRTNKVVRRMSARRISLAARSIGIVFPWTAYATVLKTATATAWMKIQQLARTVSPVAGIGSNVRAVSAAYTTFRFVTAMTAVVTDRTRLAVTRAFAMWATSPVTRVDALMRHSLARDFQYVETARTKAPKRAQTGWFVRETIL
jgi:hypothetical protein